MTKSFATAISKEAIDTVMNASKLHNNDQNRSTIALILGRSVMMQKRRTGSADLLTNPIIKIARYLFQNSPTNNLKDIISGTKVHSNTARRIIRDKQFQWDLPFELRQGNQKGKKKAMDKSNNKQEQITLRKMNDQIIHLNTRLFQAEDKITELERHNKRMIEARGVGAKASIGLSHKEVAEMVKIILGDRIV